MERNTRPMQLRHARWPQLSICALSIALFSSAFSEVLRGQEGDLGFRKGDKVVVLVPISLSNPKTAGFFGDQTYFDIDAALTPDGAVQILDTDSKNWRRDWRTVGFPAATQYTVKSIKTVERGKPKTKATELVLNLTDIVGIRIFTPVDQTRALKTIVAPANSADSAMKVAYDTLGARFFTGPLAGFTPEERLVILQFAHLTASGTKIASDTFKSITYLTVSLPQDATGTWNNLVVNQSKRVGHLIGEQLPLLKSFAKITLAHKGIDGLELVQSSRHGTAPSYADTKVDEVKAYFPLDAMLKFASADITSQQLINQSIILVNGDRVEVDLSSQ